MDSNASRIERAAEPEEISGAWFAVWKIKRPQKTPHFSYEFVVVVFFCVYAMLIAASYVYEQILRGNNLPLRVFGVFAGVGPLIVLFAVPAALKFKQRARAAARLDPPGRTSNVPSSAVPAIAGISRDKSLGKSFGWLWFEGGLLHFRGEAFDFDLSRDDFQRKRGIPMKAMVPYTIRVPKKVPGIKLTIAAAYAVDDKVYRAPELWSEIEKGFEAFEDSNSIGTTLLPPLRRGFELPQPWPMFTAFIGPAVLVGILFATIPLFVPIPRNTVALFLSGMGVILALGLQGLLIGWQMKSEEKTIDRIKQMGVE